MQITWEPMFGLLILAQNITKGRNSLSAVEPSISLVENLTQYKCFCALQIEALNQFQICWHTDQPSIVFIYMKVCVYMLLINRGSVWAIYPKTSHNDFVIEPNNWLLNILAV
jgi:hypothetical protein